MPPCLRAVTSIETPRSLMPVGGFVPVVFVEWPCGPIQRESSPIRQHQAITSNGGIRHPLVSRGAPLAPDRKQHSRAGRSARIWAREAASRCVSKGARRGVNAEQSAFLYTSSKSPFLPTSQNPQAQRWRPPRGGLCAPSVWRTLRNEGPLLFTAPKTFSTTKPAVKAGPKEKWPPFVNQRE